MSKQMKTISGVFLFPFINRTTAKYKTDGKELKDQEYTTRILVKKADIKAIKKVYPKNSMGAPKEYTSSEFKKAFGFNPPSEYDAGDDEFLVLSFNKHASYKDGKPTVAPEILGVKVVDRAKGIYKDRNGVQFDQEVMLSSGTEGILQFKPRQTGKGADEKTKLDLWKVQVHHLVEYIPADEDVFELEDDEDEGSAFEMDEGSTSDSNESTDEDDDEWDD